MKLGLGYQVLIAVIAGIFIGLFLGPIAAIFRPIGTAYIMLLEMIVVPYISLSIIQGIGSLTPVMAKKLFKKGWGFWLLFWSLMFLMIFFVSQLIPKPLSGNVFQLTNAPSTLEKDLTKNILMYLIPQNLVYDFVNNVVPSIAVFGIIVGVALMYIEKKEPLLSLIDRGNQIIEKILYWLAEISPIGVFAHISVITGTIYLEDFYKIDFYVVSFILITLFLTFWILPLILTSLTSMTYRDTLHAFRSVCLLSFVTGVSTIAIPFINHYLRKMGEQAPIKGEGDYRTTSRTMLPLAYSFTQIGNGLLLFFILFASFYYRHPFSLLEESLLSFLTIPLSIGSSTIMANSVTFLFNELQFPANAMELFTATMPITGNFQVLLSVASVLSLIILVIFANYHLLHVRWKRLIFGLLGSFSAVAICIFAIRPHIHLEDSYRNLYMNLKLSNALQNPVEAKIYQANDELPYLSEIDPQEGVLERVLRTNVLRVGYESTNIPYVYFNKNNELVGFDVAMAYQLAKDLNCRLEFVPLRIDHLAEELNQGKYDIAMSAILMSEERIPKMNFSHTYTDQNNVLLIPAAKKEEFSKLEKVQNEKNLTIGALGSYRRVCMTNFPKATIYDKNFDPDALKDKVDVWIWSSVPATIWCLNHPNYYVEAYDGLLGKSYFAYPVRSDVTHFLSLLNNWLELKLIDNFYQDQTKYWILGEPILKSEKPRWSIIRDVFHWLPSATVNNEGNVSRPLVFM